MQKIKFHILIVLTLLIYSCDSTNKKNEQNSPKHGGEFSLVKPLVQIDKFKPSSISVYGTVKTLSCALEPLIRTNPVSLKIEPVIAESFSLSDNCTKVTFKIRKGVYFHDHKLFKDGKGREVKAADIKFCLDYFADTSQDNYEYSAFESTIKGLKEHRESIIAGSPLKEGVSGVKIIDDYTISIELLKPSCTILEQLAGKPTWIFPREIIDQNTNFDIEYLVGTGGFQFESSDSVKLVFKRNNNYWNKDEDGFQLPYLDKLTFYYRDHILTFEEQIDAFVANKIDIVEEIRATDIDLLMEKLEDTKFEYNSKESLNFGALIYNCTKPPFDNKWIRKALSHAINRVKITDSLFNGDFYYSDRGFSISNNFYDPPVYSNEYNLDSSQYYLKKAGYNSFKEIPDIHIKILKKSTGFIAMIDIIKRETGAPFIIDTIENTRDFNLVMQGAVMGDYQCFIGTKFLDYISPESILRMFNGKFLPEKENMPSPYNISRYKSQEVDSLLNVAASIQNKDERLLVFKKAESILVKECPMEPLFYSEVNLLNRPSMKNISLSVIGEIDFNIVYWEK